MYSYDLEAYACIQTSFLEKIGSSGGEQSKTIQLNLSKKHKNNKSLKVKRRGKNNKNMKDKRRGKNNKSMKDKRRGRNNRQKHRQRRRKKYAYSPMRRLAKLGQLNTKATFHNQQASRALVSLSVEVKLPYDPVCPSDGWLVNQFVRHNFL